VSECMIEHGLEWSDGEGRMGWEDFATGLI
jgi:hypothetical protein